MAATMEPNMLDSIIEQAVSLPAPLRLVLGDQESKQQNKFISLKLNEHLQEIKTMKGSTANLKRRTDRLKSANFSVADEVSLTKSFAEVIRICKRLQVSFDELCKHHFWLRRKGHKINGLLRGIMADTRSIRDNLQQFFTATDWERETYLASQQPDWNDQLAANAVTFSANDAEAFSRELEIEPVLTFAQKKAQQRYLAHKKVS